MKKGHSLQRKSQSGLNCFKSAEFVFIFEAMRLSFEYYVGTMGKLQPFKCNILTN